MSWELLKKLGLLETDVSVESLYSNWLLGYSSLLGPIAGIMIVDYFLSTPMSPPQSSGSTPTTPPFPKRASRRLSIWQTRWNFVLPTWRMSSWTKMPTTSES